MPLSFDEIRSSSLSFPGVEEGISHGTPAFYVRGKLLLRLQESGDSFSLGCLRSERETLIENYPDAFFITEHFRNFDYILVNRLAINVVVFQRLFEAAWRRRASKVAIQKFEADKCSRPNK